MTEEEVKQALDTAMGIAIKGIGEKERYKNKIDLMDRKISCLYWLYGLSTVLYVASLNVTSGDGSMDTFCTGWALGCLSSLLIMIVYDWRRRHID